MTTKPPVNPTLEDLDTLQTLAPGKRRQVESTLGRSETNALVKELNKNVEDTLDKLRQDAVAQADFLKGQQDAQRRLREAIEEQTRVQNLPPPPASKPKKLLIKRPEPRVKGASPAASSPGSKAPSAAPAAVSQSEEAAAASALVEKLEAEVAALRSKSRSLSEEGRSENSKLLETLRQQRRLRDQLLKRDALLAKLESQPEWFNYAAAFGASCVSTLVMHPVDTIKIRQVAEQAAAAGMSDGPGGEGGTPPTPRAPAPSPPPLATDPDGGGGSSLGEAASASQFASARVVPTGQPSSGGASTATPVAAPALASAEVLATATDFSSAAALGASSSLSEPAPALEIPPTKAVFATPATEAPLEHDSSHAATDEHEAPRVGASGLDDLLSRRQAALDAMLVEVDESVVELEAALLDVSAAPAESEILTGTVVPVNTPHAAGATAATALDVVAADAVAEEKEGGFDVKNFLSLYQGLPGALLKEGPPSAIYLGVYEAAKTRLIATPWLSAYPLLVYLLAGALGETFGSLLRAPAEAIKTRLQSGMDASTAESFQSVLGNAEGRKNVATAWRSSLFRDVPFGAIQLAVFELLKAYLINQPGTGGFDIDTLYAEAVLGATGGFIGSLLTTPPDVVTVRIMTQEGDGSDGEEAASMTDMVSEIYKQDGAKGFMTGWQARTGYWAPAIGIFLSCYCGSAHLPHAPTCEMPARPCQHAPSHSCLASLAVPWCAVRQFAATEGLF